MKKLIMIKGLPASGKTTWARQYLKDNPNTKRINKDELRAMLDDSKWNKENEKFILHIRDTVIAQAFNNGYSVIVDDTNFASKHELWLKEIANNFKVEFEIKDFTDVPLDTCIKRDARRANSVGVKVIMQMWKQFLKPEPKVVERRVELADAIICDIDGTLALFGDASPYDRDFSKDILNLPVRDLLCLYNKTCKVILVSGRKDKYREQTEDWLNHNAVPFDFLYMRKTQPDGIQEPKDDIIKKEIYEEYIKGKYNIEFVIDDRPRIIRMWRDEGLFVFDVGDGMEF